MRKWIVLWMALSAVPLWGDVPQKITYQGTLKQTGAAANGTYTMTFRLTDSSGVTQYWSSGPTSVNVSQGLFSAILSPTGVNWATVSPYIEVNVNGQVLLPREAVTSTAYAMECGSISGMIAMFAGSCPSGWTRFSAMDGLFPMGGAAYGATGGSATHNHSISMDGEHNHGGRTGIPNEQIESDAGHNFGSPVLNHTHSISMDGAHNHGGATASASSLPPYLTVVFCQKQ